MNKQLKYFAVNGSYVAMFIMAYNYNYENASGWGKIYKNEQETA